MVPNTTQAYYSLLPADSVLTTNHNKYIAIPYDLRSADHSDLLKTLLHIATSSEPVDVTEAASKKQKVISIPTLFITECVLVYLDQSATQGLLQALTLPSPDKPTCFSNYIWCSYDIINPTDAFGRQLVKNLSSTFSIPGLFAYPQLKDRENCFLLTKHNNPKEAEVVEGGVCNEPGVNMNQSHCMTMLAVYHQLISREEKMRISK